MIGEEIKGQIMVLLQFNGRIQDEIKKIMEENENQVR